MDSEKCDIMLPLVPKTKCLNALHDRIVRQMRPKLSAGESFDETSNFSIARNCRTIISIQTVLSYYWVLKLVRMKIYYARRRNADEAEIELLACIGSGIIQ